MKLVTFTPTGSTEPAVGLVQGDLVLDLTGHFPTVPAFQSMLSLIDAGLDAFRSTVGSLLRQPWSIDDPGVSPLDEVRLLAPIPRPRNNVFCVGLNYVSHVEQNARALGQAVEIPATPLFFGKPVGAVVGPNAPISLDPRLTDKLDYEVELAVVIGTRGTWIAEGDAEAHIFGYTVGNDVSARDLQFRHSQFFYGKGQDTYCPLGPAVVTTDEITDLAGITVSLSVNGEIRQQESAGNMIFSPAQAISWLSQGITLEPGDVILLGTPGGCGYQLTPPRFLGPGDVVEAGATSIGVLRNVVSTVGR
jgi:2-keto-4-pentenoate hydratase/2-oxohepta-3-ene-1,7-dioic acid hydratase in catechol pathway